MDEVFDPEKVERTRWVDYGYEGWAYMPDTEENRRVHLGDFPNTAKTTVSSSDYDQLLAFYRESIALDLKFWPCKEGNHTGCARKKEIECSCECHRNTSQIVVK